VLTPAARPVQLGIFLSAAMASLPSGGEQSDRDDYEYSTSDDDAEYSWIGWFCSRKGHEFLCEVQLLRNLKV
jgi:hypothetical protein